MANMNIPPPLSISTDIVENVQITESNESLKVQIAELKTTVDEMNKRMESLIQMVGNILAQTQSNTNTSKSIDAGSPSNSVVAIATKTTTARKMGAKVAVQSMAKTSEARAKFSANAGVADELDGIYKALKAVKPNTSEAMLWKESYNSLYDARDAAAKSALAKIALAIVEEQEKVTASVPPLVAPTLSNASALSTPPIGNMTPLAPVFTEATPVV